MSSVLGVFAKQPQPGTVKTRLASAIGPERAAAVYAAFVDDILATHRETADKRVLCYAPESADAQAWAAGVAGEGFLVQAQSDGDLGHRIRTFFEHTFSETRAERVVLIGSDSPDLPADYVGNALQSLQTSDVVLGPAVDGGVYLIGLRQRPDNLCKRLFEGIDWSTSRVFEQLLQRVRASEVSLEVLPLWYDVDTLDDARFLQTHLEAAQYSGRMASGSRTAELLPAVLDHAGAE